MGSDSNPPGVISGSLCPGEPSPAPMLVLACALRLRPELRLPPQTDGAGEGLRLGSGPPGGCPGPDTAGTSRLLQDGSGRQAWERRRDLPGLAEPETAASTPGAPAQSLPPSFICSRAAQEGPKLVIFREDDITVSPGREGKARPGRCIVSGRLRAPRPSTPGLCRGNRGAPAVVGA